MDKNKISDFLTPDISYLLGLITGRGEIQATSETKRIVLDFEFKSLQARAINQVFDQRLHIQTSLDAVILRLQNLGLKTRKVVSDNKITIVLQWEQEDLSWQFIKFLINGTRFNYHDFVVPPPLFLANTANQKEFLRGLSDITGYVRNSNRDQRGRHRVYLEISNKNWHLPPQLCQLTQGLGVAVQNINYGHPNLRGGTGTSWAKEHQIKIYAEDYAAIGFYISHKNEALQELAAYNQANFSRSQALCSGYSKRPRLKPAHSQENHEKLPPEIRNRHFNDFREICGCLGCYLQTDGGQ